MVSITQLAMHGYNYITQRIGLPKRPCWSATVSQPSLRSTLNCRQREERRPQLSFTTETRKPCELGIPKSLQLVSFSPCNELCHFFLQVRLSSQGQSDSHLQHSVHWRWRHCHWKGVHAGVQGAQGEWHCPPGAFLPQGAPPGAGRDGCPHWGQRGLHHLR